MYTEHGVAVQKITFRQITILFSEPYVFICQLVAWICCKLNLRRDAPTADILGKVDGNVREKFTQSSSQGF